MSNLFSSYIIKNKKVKNRVVMPPMVYFGLTDDSGFVTDVHVKHYESRAAGETGVIIVEATCVNKSGRLSDSQLGIWSDQHIQGLKQISDACHKHGALVLIQIHHAGLQAPRKVTPNCVSSSEYTKKGKTCKALDIEEIHLLEQDFTMAAIRAKKAGFDGIELHGAHGYLISQFASPIINKRNDEYGGSIAGRMRFSLNIIEKIRKATGRDFIIGYRMGGNEPSLENGIEIAKLLEAAGVDLLHVSSGISDKEPPIVPEDFPYSWIVFCGTEIKKHINIPVIVVNRIRTPKQATYLVENNMADFVAIGQGLLSDPEWALKAKLQTEIIPCLECPRCLWFSRTPKCPERK